MNEIQIFNSSEFGEIRTLAINGEPWFVGVDVAKALGYTRTRKAVYDHVDPEDKLTVPKQDGIKSPNGATAINESGLYSLIFASKLPTAKQFKRWVTSEVLPQIRKTGMYTANSDFSDDDTVTPMRLLSPDDYLSAARLVANCGNDRLGIVLALLSKGGWEIPQIANQHFACPDTSDIAERIKRARDATGWTLKDLSRTSGISTEVLRSYECGRRFPKQERYSALVMLLDNIESKEAAPDGKT